MLVFETIGCTVGIDRADGVWGLLARGPREEGGLALPTVKGSVEGGNQEGLVAWDPGLREWALQWPRVLQGRLTYGGFSRGLVKRGQSVGQ